MHLPSPPPKANINLIRAPTHIFCMLGTFMMLNKEIQFYQIPRSPWLEINTHWKNYETVLLLLWYEKYKTWQLYVSYSVRLYVDLPGHIFL